MTSKYLFLGDTHGDCDFLECAMYLASEEGCQEIIQAGDWAFIWPKINQVSYLSTLLERYGLTMRFVDGNHDHHPALRELLDRAWSRFLHGEQLTPNEISPGIFYQERGSVHIDTDDTRFLFCGGAPSIDKDIRLDRKLPWWSEEEITDQEFQLALDAQGPFHVLVTHDAPARPPGFATAGSKEFQVKGDRNLGIIAGLMEKHKPGLLVHGHWHHRYERSTGVTTVVGLASNMQTLEKASMIWSRE